MEKSAQITTLIPTFQRASFLSKAIQSALNQTFRDIEVAVFDNASSDHTAKVVQEFISKDPRVKYYRHPQTMPAPDNFQVALNSVKTPYFSFLADDDYLLPEFYAHGMRFLHQYPEAMFFVGATPEITSTGALISNNAAKWPLSEFFVPSSGVLEVLSHYVNWTGTLFRKEIGNNLRINTKVKPIDFEFIAQAAVRFPFAFSPKPCAVFVQHPHSYSFQSGLKLILPSFETIKLELLQKCARDLQRQIVSTMDRLITQRLKGLLASSLSSRNKKEFSEILFCLIKYSQKYRIFLSCIDNAFIFFFLRTGVLSLKSLKRFFSIYFVNNF